MDANKKALYGRATRILLVFLLLIPFRLPISVLFVATLDKISTLGTSGFAIEASVLDRNIIITKIVYDIVLAILFVWNVEKLSRKLYGRNADEGPMFWHNWILLIAMIPYTVVDIISTNELLPTIRLQKDDTILYHYQPRNMFGDIEEQGEDFYYYKAVPVDTLKLHKQKK